MKPCKLPDEIADLTEDQRTLLHEWLDLHSYRKVMELFKTEFGVPISYSKIQRYNAHRETAEDLSTYHDTTLDADALIDLYNAKPGRFDQAGITLIQKRAFEFAAEKDTSVSKLTGLLRIFGYQKQVEIKERHTRAVEKIADSRVRMVDIQEAESAARMVRNEEQPKRKSSSKTDAQPAEGERKLTAAEVVLRYFGTVGKFSRQVRPGERITEAIRRLYQDLQDGKLPPKDQPPAPESQSPQPENNNSLTNVNP